MTHPQTVLIVEDDRYILKAMAYKSTESGFETKTTTNAENALKLLEDWQPSVIVLDILLPGIDGYAFLRIVKNNPKWKDIPIIIASNLSEEEDYKIGASEYIVKSDLDLDDLVTRAKKYCLN
jgi:twitching motility two-component system response regulator PilH